MFFPAWHRQAALDLYFSIHTEDRIGAGVNPLCGNISFVTFAWPPSLLLIRGVIHVLQNHTMNQVSALQAGRFSRLALEQHCCSEQTLNVGATWDTLHSTQVGTNLFCQAAQT